VNRVGTFDWGRAITPHTAPVSTPLKRIELKIQDEYLDKLATTWGIRCWLCCLNNKYLKFILRLESRGGEIGRILRNIEYLL
jgi:hypothetical protein